MQDTEIKNRVAQSPLLSLDLEKYLQPGERVEMDIKEWLFQGVILKEKDFRAAVKAHDWSQYEGRHVALICSAEAIVPTWAYMLLTIQLAPYAATVIHGSITELEKILFKTALDKIDLQEFAEKKVVVKGCGNLPVPEFAFVEITRKLQPVVNSLMYGEPCSTVPLFKKPRK